MRKLTLGSQLLIARRLSPGRYTWTLPSLLGDMLQIAQSKFGPRDPAYTLLGVEFCGDHPRVWCPGNRKDMIIQLSESCMDEPQRACYQMAHECIHLLGPTGCESATVLEEGLATWFAQYYLAERIGNPNWRSTTPSYTRAQRRVERLLALDAGAIKTLRQVQPTFNHFTPELLLEHYPALGEADAAALVAPFERDTPDDAQPLGEDAPAR
jgi:hypothetical protein